MHTDIQKWCFNKFLYIILQRSSDMRLQSCFSEKSEQVYTMQKYSGREFASQIQCGFSSADKKKNEGVEFRRWLFLSSLFFHSFDGSPSFQVGEEQRKVDDVCRHADHAEVPQDKGENWCEIEWAGHRDPGGKDQKHGCLFGQRQSCNEDRGVQHINKRDCMRNIWKVQR